MELNGIKEILDRIKKIPEVVAIFLFGSQAKEETKPISDIDIAVIVDNPSREIEADIGSFSSQKIDLVLFHRLPLHIKFEVLKYGKVLYIRDEEYLTDIELNVLREYLEFSHFYKNITAEILK